jgi:hypothetical protein
MSPWIRLTLKFCESAEVEEEAEGASVWYESHGREERPPALAAAPSYHQSLALNLLAAATELPWEPSVGRLRRQFSYRPPPHPYCESPAEQEEGQPFDLDPAQRGLVRPRLVFARATATAREEP